MSVPMTHVGARRPRYRTPGGPGTRAIMREGCLRAMRAVRTSRHANSYANSKGRALACRRELVLQKNPSEILPNSQLELLVLKLPL